jgi:hypothetical protein
MSKKVLEEAHPGTIARGAATEYRQIIRDSGGWRELGVPKPAWDTLNAYVHSHEHGVPPTPWQREVLGYCYNVLGPVHKGGGTF